MTTNTLKEVMSKQKAVVRLLQSGVNKFLAFSLLHFLTVTFLGV